MSIKTPFDVAHDALVENWSKTHPYMLAGFRDDMGDVAQWVAYCAHNQPVKYDFYIRMLSSAVVLPDFSDAQIADAVGLLPDVYPCDLLKKSLHEHMARALQR